MTRVLLIGINEYKIKENNLYGCLNDLYLLYRTLLQCKIDKSNIYSLSNSLATKRRILDGLRWLVRSTKKDDSAIFYYSGHGTQTPSIRRSELDEYDEAIVPYDYNTEDNTLIHDYKIKAVLDEIIEGSIVDVIMDCCHSGTITRNFIIKGLFKKKLITPTARYIDPSLTILRSKQIPYNFDKKKEFTSINLNHALITACASYQTSKEVRMGGRIDGVFTKYFCDLLQKKKSIINRRDLIDALQKSIPTSYDQIPQLECSVRMSERLIFK